MFIRQIKKHRQRNIGLLVVVFSYGYIAFRLSNIKLDFSGIMLNNDTAIYILFVLILSYLNIFTEAYKWKVLMSSFYKIKIKQALKMIISGFSTGIFTPGKLGEPYGRIIFLPSQHKTKGTILNYLGGAFQNVIILILGITFLVFISLNNSLRYIVIFQYLFLSTLLILITFILLYSIRNTLYIYLLRYNWTNNLLKSILTIKEIKLKKYLIVFLLSLTRYLLYCSQLIILLYTFFEFKFQWSIILWVPIYFMCITLIPSFLLADLGVRNSVAIFLFAPFFSNEINVLLAVSVLWFVNQVIPALCGSAYIIQYSKSL